MSCKIGAGAVDDLRQPSGKLEGHILDFFWTTLFVPSRRSSFLTKFSRFRVANAVGLVYHDCMVYLFMLLLRVDT
jgi:hypothetical protein